MEEKEILAKVANTILDKQVAITIDILKPKEPEVIKETFLEKILIALGLKKRIPVPEPETKKVFEIKKAPLSTLIKISLELLDIDLNIFDPNRLLDSNYKLIAEHGTRMARIAAIAVTNPREQPPEELVDFFLENLTSEELHKVVGIVMQQMDIANFMTTIISIKGQNVLQAVGANAINAKPSEVSQQIAEELIASGRRSAE